MAYLAESFERALVRHVERNVAVPVAEIVAYSEDTESSGGCNTYAFDWTVVNVTYRDDTGDVRKYQYSGGFMELVNDLLQED